jgi:hypothetical protein
MRFLIISLVLFACSLIPSILLVLRGAGRGDAGNVPLPVEADLSDYMGAEKATLCPSEEIHPGHESKPCGIDRESSVGSWVWEAGKHMSTENTYPSLNHSDESTLGLCSRRGRGVDIAESPKRWGQEEARNCLAGKHIMIVGNSVTKQQYMVSIPTSIIPTPLHHRHSLKRLQIART